MKTLYLALTLAALMQAADVQPAPSSATVAERLAVAEKSNALLNEEIAFDQRRIAALQAQLQAYEKALLEPAGAAKQALDAEIAKAAKAHAADGCQLRTDGSWDCATRH